MAKKKTSSKGTLATIYDKTKEVISDVLHGAADGAVAGATVSAVKVVGGDTDNNKRSTKARPAKKTSTAKKAAPAKKATAKKAPSSAKSSAPKKAAAKKAPAKKTAPAKKKK